MNSTTVSTVTEPGLKMHVGATEPPKDVAIEEPSAPELSDTTNRTTYTTPENVAPHETNGVDVTPAQSLQEENKPTSTRLFYLKDLPLYKTTKPVQIVPGFADKEGLSNVKLEAGPRETINDVRGHEHEFTLEQNGFRYLHYPTNVTDFESRDALETDYLRECERLLKREVEGVDEVVFFDARLRKSQSQGTRGDDGLSTNPFARQVHVDELETSIVTRIRSQTELKADFLLRGRIRVINIWRPVSHPVYDCALALTDTVRSNLTVRDVIECDRVRRDTGKFHDTMGVIQHRPGYSWWYMSEQTPDEPVMFMGYDSACTQRIARQEDVDGNPGFCFHTAFDVPEPYPEGWQPRESIEVRALVFTYPHITRVSPLRNPPAPGEEKKPLRTRSFSYDTDLGTVVGSRGGRKGGSRQGSRSRRESRRDSLAVESGPATPNEQDEDMKNLMEELAALKAALNKEKSAREDLEAQVKALKGGST